MFVEFKGCYQQRTFLNINDDIFFYSKREVHYTSGKVRSKKEMYLNFLSSRNKINFVVEINDLFWWGEYVKRKRIIYYPLFKYNHVYLK